MQSQLVETVASLQELLRVKGTTASAAAVDDLDAVVEGVEAGEPIDKTTLVRALKAVGGQLSQTMKAELARATEGIQAVKAQSEADKHWAKWEREHPVVAGRLDELLASAQDTVDTRYGSLARSVQDGAFRAIFDALVSVEEAKASKIKDDNVPEKKAPPAASVTPKGAKGSAGKQSKAIPAELPGPLWVPA
jgi:hypothetical protein